MQRRACTMPSCMPAFPRRWSLSAAGCRLIVATSKPHHFARPILQHFALARHFAAIHGPELDGTARCQDGFARPHPRRAQARSESGDHGRRPRVRRRCRQQQWHRQHRRGLGLRQHCRASRRWGGEHLRCTVPAGAADFGRRQIISTGCLRPGGPRYPTPVELSHQRARRRPAGVDAPRSVASFLTLRETAALSWRAI